MRYLWLGLILSTVVGCGGDVTSDHLCPIDCTSTFSGRSDVYQISVNGSASQDYQCLSEKEPTPVTVQFLISKDNSTRPSSVPFNDAEKAALNLKQQPLQRVAFYPVLSGVRDASKTNPTIVDVCDGCGLENPGIVKVSPYKFHGVTTPKSEWCSDSCGIASYTFIPKCGNGGSDSIVSGIAFGSVSGLADDSTSTATISVNVQQIGTASAEE